MYLSKKLWMWPPVLPLTAVFLIVFFVNACRARCFCFGINGTVSCSLLSSSLNVIFVS